jgi:hypothetical protein
VVLIYFNKRMFKRTVNSPCPSDGEWDIAADKYNYRSTCNRPFWHESHHIVPNGALHEAITDVGEGTSIPKEITIKVRDGLLDALYNINHKRNMIILPIEAQIGKAILLPLHVDRLKGEGYRHSNYSAYVREKLNEIFGPVKSKIDPAKHQVPPMDDTKTGLEGLSDTLRVEIKAAGSRSPGTSLDDNFAPGEAL